MSARATKPTNAHERAGWREMLRDERRRLPSDCVLALLDDVDALTAKVAELREALADTVADCDVSARAASELGRERDALRAALERVASGSCVWCPADAIAREALAAHERPVAQEAAGYRERVQALVDVARACRDGLPGLEPWNVLCDAVEALEHDHPEAAP